MGSMLTKFAVHKIVLKQGGSTLGGTEIYFDKVYSASIWTSAALIWANFSR